MYKQFKFFNMKKVIILSAGILLGIINTANAQKTKLESGNLSALKGEKVFNLQYEYADLKVGNKEEADYIKEKVEKYNNTEAGKGDKWKEAWFNDRKKRYQPKFEELLNKYFAEEGISAASDKKDAKYTIIVKTFMIEPGFNIELARMPAVIYLVFNIVKTAEQSNSIAKITMNRVPGTDVAGFDYDSGYRISEAYAKAGKVLAKFMIKNINQ